jgi:multiple sugar transport system substrate-binding protein
MWTFGAQEVDEDQNVIINSQEMRDCLDWFRVFWNEACDTSALAWDDSANNRAFLAQQIALTKNASSIYFFAKHNPDRTPEGMAENTNHHLGPVGPAGRYHILAPNSRCILRNSPNVDAAKDFLRFMMEPERYDEWIMAQEGFSTPYLPSYENHPMWDADPKISAFREIAKYGRNFGHAGPFNRKASEAQVKYIVVDIFARVARGDSTEEAIAWGESELKQVYET